MQDDFRALVARMHRGDPDAVRQFIAAYGDAIRRAARRRILQIGLERSVDPDHILDAIVFELCQTLDDLGNIDLEELWTYVDRAVHFEATSVWRHRNRAAQSRATVTLRSLQRDSVVDPRPSFTLITQVKRVLGAGYAHLRQTVDLVLRTVGK